MLIYFWVVLVISPAGFLEDLIGCSAICIICDSNHIVSMLKCMCSQNKVIHSFNSLLHKRTEPCTYVNSLLHKPTEPYTYVNSLLHKPTEPYTYINSLLHKRTEPCTYVNSLLHKPTEPYTYVNSLLHKST